MIVRTLHTQKYDVDLERLLSRRLMQTDCTFATEPIPGGVAVSVQGNDALMRLSEAVATLLCRDLQYFELAHMTDALPLDLPQKQEVLTEALESARCLERIEEVRRGVEDYLATENEMNVEGYLRFRMRERMETWQLCVERAAADLMLCSEWAELMELLSALSQGPGRRIGEISVCLNPDGSCTLTDDSDVRIEYVDCSEEGIVRLLMSMAPERLTVYDLSGGRSHLAETLTHVFAGRVRVFR